jgi:DNA replication protein DnaC
MKELIVRYCKQLKWGQSIVENYQDINAESHDEFLAKLLKMELESRELVRKNRYLKQASFDVVKTFEGYEFRDIQIPQGILHDDLLDPSGLISRRENLILYGPVGTGKTHLATAIGVAACNQSKRVKFYRTAALVNELIDAKSSGNLNRFLKQLEKTDLLICDEWGFIPLDRQGAQLLFQVIAGCYEKRSVIITTNLEFGKWNGIFYDEKLTTAIIDRLVHHSHLLVFTGKSYRLEHSSIRH